MTVEAVLVDRPAPGVLIATMNRPEKLNAITGDMLGTLIQVAASCAAESVRAVIVTGSGRAFSSGGDVKALVAMTHAEVGKYLGAYGLLDDAIAESGAVWVAALNGLAYGGGLEVACMCDVRIADAWGSFCVADLEVGALPTGGLTWRLPRMVGSGRASWMVMANAVADAPAALEMGLVDEVVPHGTTVTRAMEIAAKVASFHAAAIRANRLALRKSWSSSMAEAKQFEVSESMRLLADDRVMGPLRARFGKP